MYLLNRSSLLFRITSISPFRYALLSPSLGTNCEKNSPESEEKGLILVNNSSVLVKFSCGLSLVRKTDFNFILRFGL